MSAPRHLDALAPGLDRIVRPLDLVDRPTPITAEPELARHWGLSELWVKRDDRTSPYYGGSKVRNLEFFLGVARRQGAPAVATMGPLGSHQALATAVFGRLAGFKTKALLVPQPPVREVELNARLLPSLGMDVIRCESYFQIPLGFLRTRWGEKNTYWIPPGAKHPLGVLGVVESVLELAAAVKDGSVPCPEDVVVPTGTCATAAGVLLGLAMAALPVRLVAVRLVPMLITGPGKMRKLAAATLALLRKAGYGAPVRWGEVRWVDDFAGPGYGQGGPEASQAMQDVAQLGGFRTELTYTGKCLGLLATGGLAGRRVLFWNTYSAIDPDPALIPVGALA